MFARVPVTLCLVQTNTNAQHTLSNCSATFQAATYLVPSLITKAAHHAVEDGRSSAIAVEEGHGCPEATEEQKRATGALKP
jgi:hypothetical protein